MGKAAKASAALAAWVWTERMAERAWSGLVCIRASALLSASRMSEVFGRARSPAASLWEERKAAADLSRASMDARASARRLEASLNEASKAAMALMACCAFAERPETAWPASLSL